MARIVCFLALLSVFVFAWGPLQLVADSEKKGWLSEDWQDARKQVQSHFRGFDVAMMEVGHRFRELFFAGQDENWDYADYQLEKIKTAIRLAMERRPKRAQSAATFLENDLLDVERLMKERSPASFDAGMRRLQTSCMKCHVAENVPFFTVQFPKNNSSPIRLHNEEGKSK